MTIPILRYRYQPQTALRARLLPSVPALEISLRVDGGFIQWRRGESGTWENLIATADLIGTPEEILAGLITVDGAGSGLDADLLDGQEGSFYLDYNNFTNTPTALSGDTLIVTAGGAVVVGDGDGHIIINKAAPSVTPITLGPVADRDGLPLHVVDFSGNGGDITLTPDGSETVMGLASATLVSNGQGLGLAASITIYPSVDLGGWYA